MPEKKTTFEVKVNNDTLRFFTKEDAKNGEKRVIFGYNDEKTHATHISSPIASSTHQSTHEKGKHPEHQNILPSTNPNELVVRIEKEIKENAFGEEYTGADLRLFNKMDEIRALFLPVTVERDGQEIQQRDILQTIKGIFSIMLDFFENPGEYIDLGKIKDYEERVLVNDAFQFFIVYQGKVIRYNDEGFGKMVGGMTLGQLTGSSFMMDQEVLKNFLSKVSREVSLKEVIPRKLLDEKQ